MKQHATFFAVTVAFLSSLLAGPAFADADHKYPQSTSTDAVTNTQVSGAAVSREYARDSYGAEASGTTQSGTRSRPDLFTVNGRSLYANP
ncbi:hypothetical protein [Burkholderia sp. AU4i]|uniref:hypothetical protein n=1 Tax=Burkholderia sp. AU4i TaxID=1335308 RepID=UPI0012DC1395|nr:hypothetical protein [Burkholderia sp. AU4i]